MMMLRRISDEYLSGLASFLLFLLFFFRSLSIEFTHTSHEKPRSEWKRRDGFSVSRNDSTKSEKRRKSDGKEKRERDGKMLATDTHSKCVCVCLSVPGFAESRKSLAVLS